MRVPLFAAAAVLSASLAAHADQLYTYKLVGIGLPNSELPPGHPEQGLLTLDASDLLKSTAQFALADSDGEYGTVIGEAPPTEVIESEGPSGQHVLELLFQGRSYGEEYDNTLYINIDGGYDDAVLCVADNNQDCLRGKFSFLNDSGLIGLFEGGAMALETTTMPASVTPEPSSIALLGTGMLGVAGVVRKRFAA